MAHQRGGVGRDDWDPTIRCELTMFHIPRKAAAPGVHATVQATEKPHVGPGHDQKQDGRIVGSGGALSIYPTPWRACGTSGKAGRHRAPETYGTDATPV